MYDIELYAKYVSISRYCEQMEKRNRKNVMFFHIAIAHILIYMIILIIIYTYNE